ncbi:MAG: fused MFS/spermidine synthase, partial [Flavobacteriales bacterium]
SLWLIFNLFPLNSWKNQKILTSLESFNKFLEVNRYMKKSPSKYLYLLAFLEGSSVMACEVSGAKLASPFFGTSLYVWGTSLSIALIALSLGYFTSGWLSKKLNVIRTLLWTLAAASILLIYMPDISKEMISDSIVTQDLAGKKINEAEINNEFITDAIFCMSSYMFFPLFLFGMVPTMISHRLNNVLEKTGNTVGKVFTISTIGGIISTYLIGFYLLPEFGTANTLLVFGGLTGGTAVIFLFINLDLLAFIPLFILITGFFKTPEINKNKDHEILYHSKGILGDLKVVEQPYTTQSGKKTRARIFFMNNISQTIMNANKLDRTLWEYAHYFTAPAEVFPVGSKVLLLGLGGGTFYNQFKHMGHQVDIVEFDERTAEIAKEYFNVKPENEIIIDDARHYINVTQKEYEVITCDLYKSERPPAYVLTYESFKRIKEVLSEKGMLIINFYRNFKGEKGKPLRSIVKTLKKAGFFVELLQTPGNMVIIASKIKRDYSGIEHKYPSLPTIKNLNEKFLDKSKLDLSKDPVLYDHKPILKKMFVKNALERRNIHNYLFARQFLDED